MTDPTQPTPPDQPENYDIPDAVEQITPDMVGPSLVGHTINRLYRVEKMLGQGGMGWVVQVLHLRLLRREAMKLPMKDFMADAEYMKRFRREALTMARFEHPNIVQVYDVHIADSADDVSYITMEFVEGLSIDQYVLLHQNRLTVGDLLVMITKLAKALDKAHEKNVIHRDIKPANIAIKLSDEEPKLMDFGVARADIATAYKTEYHTTGANSSSFTAAYAAPEQIMGKPVTGAADIYAFAMTIYKLMGRRFPFDAENAAAFIIAQVQGTPIPLHERNPNWPTTLNTPLSKAMAKNPEDRQHSATQFAEELVQALSGYEKIPLVKMFDAQTALPPLAISSAPTLSVASVTIPAVLPGELVPPPKRMSGLVTAILSFLFFSLVGAGVYFVMDGKGAAFKDPGNYFPTLKARAQQAAAGDPSTLLPVWETPTPSATPSPSPTLTPTPSLTPSPTRSVTPSPSISPSPAPSPVVVVPTATPEPSPTPTPAPTEEPSPVPTESPTVSPTPTPEPTPSLVPTPREVKPFFAVSADEDAVSIIIIEEKFISSDRLTTVYPKRSESFLRRLAQTMNKPAVNAIAPDPSVPIAAGSEPFPFERIQWITDDPSQALLLAGKYMQWYGESLKGTPREVAPEKLREKITCAVSASLLDSTAMTNRSLSIPGCWAVEGGVLKWNPSQFSRVEARGRSGDSLEHVPFVCFNSQ